MYNTGPQLRILRQMKFDAEDRWDEQCNRRIAEIGPFAVLERVAAIARDVEYLVEACYDCLDESNSAYSPSRMSERRMLFKAAPSERRMRVRKAIRKVRHFFRCTLQSALEEHDQIQTQAESWNPNFAKKWRPAVVLAERTERPVHVWLGRLDEDDLPHLHEVLEVLISLAAQQGTDEAPTHPSVLLGCLLKQQHVLRLWNISLPDWFEAIETMNEAEEEWSFWKAQGEVVRLSSKQTSSVIELRVKRWKESRSRLHDEMAALSSG